ncbi:MAG: UDP-N-acetylmuramate dehydrogenase [Ruminococcus sp.]
MKETFYRELCGCLRTDQILRGELMKNHTTFRVGGPADYFVVPEDSLQVKQVIGLCRRQNVPWYVIGNGSNLLVGDRGYRGVIIQIYKNMSRIEIKEGQIEAQAGALLSRIGACALGESLTGMEFACGIPGTVGGAAVMNAGAYGGEMKDILKSVTVLKENGEIEEIPSEKLELGYRTSVIKEKGYVVLEAALQLQKGEASRISARMEELKKKRIEKQPLEYPSAGSTFKRPEGYFAGKLIMDAGLRGYRVGGASVSEKHCGFVINDQGGTAADIRTLMENVQKKVWEKFQVKLEPEVKFLGEF